MAKGIYFGVNGMARKVKKLYFGIDNIARKVKKVYYGDSNNTARLCYSAGIAFSTSLSLATARYGVGGAEVADYGIFVGGYGGGGVYLSSVEAYNESLTRTNLNTGKETNNVEGVSLGTDCALFLDRRWDRLYKYNNALVRTYVDNIIDNDVTNSTFVGKNSYAFAVGGSSGEYCYAIDTNLVKAWKDYFSEQIFNRGTANVNKYSIMAGGRRASLSAFDKVSIYDNTNGSKVSGTFALSKIRSEVSGASNSKYAIFAGGFTYDSQTNTMPKLNMVEAYDSNLVRYSVPSLPKPRSYIKGISLDDYALFAGGIDDAYTNVIEVYNTNLVREESLYMSTANTQFTATKVADKLLIGGGWDGSVVQSQLDIFIQ